ncbi:hypothetical protein GCM10029964_056670 [Kibdelosporangium lantanae]
MRQVLGGNTRTGVGDFDHRPAVRPAHAHGHLIPRTGITGRVAHKVAERLVQPVGVAMDQHSLDQIGVHS